ncbi:helix-turn-helix transcriptional regulator [Micromonospora sp. L31]|uniref:helix-turn-helix transcriptional regulator n=1 Tax=Micromonospora sp. L31 TaxID=3452213 RepID=UPI003F8B7523
MSTYMNPTEQTSNNTTDITPAAVASTPAAVAPVTSEVWTVDRVRALGVTTTLATTASVLGISRSQAYRLAATDQFPIPLIRAGSRIIVPVAALLHLLQLDRAATGGGGRLEAGAKVSVDATTPPPANSTRHRWRHHREHPGDDE